MSRVGGRLINIPDGVSLENKESQLMVKGPNGSLMVNLCEEVSLNIDDKVMNLSRNSDDKVAKSSNNNIYETRAYYSDSSGRARVHLCVRLAIPAEEGDLAFFTLSSLATNPFGETHEALRLRGVLFNTFLPVTY